jgi:hypothetical protein
MMRDEYLRRRAAARTSFSPRETRAVLAWAAATLLASNALMLARAPLALAAVVMAAATAGWLVFLARMRRRTERSLREHGLVCPHCGARLGASRPAEEALLETGRCARCRGQVLTDVRERSTTIRLPPMPGIDGG